MTHRKGRKPKRYSQVARISVMLRRLLGGATVCELAEEFQVTKRQLTVILHGYRAGGKGA